MRNSDYARQYKDPRWQRKRLEIMQRDCFACVECGDKKSTLNVHHIRYLKDVPVWAHPPWLLVTLCESCHEAIHDGEPSTGERLYHVARSVGMTHDDFEWLEHAFFQCVYTHEGRLTSEQWTFALNAFLDAVETFTPCDKRQPDVRECCERHTDRVYPPWAKGGEMPRIRTIKPAFWTSPQIVHVPVAARLLFIGTWNFADDNGNLPRDAERLKLQVFPADDIDVEALVCALITHGLLSEYSVSSRRFLHIVGFRDHQVISRPSHAVYPLPPETGKKLASTGDDGGTSGPSQGKNSRSTHGVVTERSMMEEEKDKTRNIKTKVKNKNTARVPRAVSAPRFDAGAYLRSLGVADDLAADWLAVRTAKHLTATRTAMAGVLREVEKTGLPLPEVLRICCEKGWGGFEAHWLENLRRDTHGPPPFALSPRDVREARNRAMVTTLTGRDPWEPPPDVIDLAPEDVRHVPDRRHGNAR